MTAIVQTHPIGRRSPFVVDAALEMRRKGLLQFFLDAWHTYGDLAPIQIGSQHIFVVVHPEHVRYISITNRQNYDKLHSYDNVRKYLLGDGLVSSTGELWKRQRRLMSPFFTPRGVEQYYPIIAADAEAFARRWQARSDNDQPVEMINEMMLITASIILRSMFSTESDEQLLSIKGAVETMIQFVALRQMSPAHLPLWLPISSNTRYRQARDLVHTYINHVVAQRRALPVAQWPDDLLSKLMLARDEETGAAISDLLLRDESITIFFAGHETTARTMAFLWYVLSQHPEVEARLHAELDAIGGDRMPTIDDLKQLGYTLQVIKETLRLYPPAPMYVRDAVAADVIDGIPIPAGSRMMLFPYATHRHPAFWEDPEKFDPDRWLPEREAQRHPLAYHPFASGQRICIGNNFSLFESHMLTALLARRFVPQLVPGHRPQIDTTGTLISKNGLPMIIRRR